MQELLAHPEGFAIVKVSLFKLHLASWASMQSALPEHLETKVMHSSSLPVNRGKMASVIDTGSGRSSVKAQVCLKLQSSQKFSTYLAL